MHVHVGWLGSLSVAAVVGLKVLALVARRTDRMDVIRWFLLFPFEECAV
jgi:hypothetical protein